MAPTLLDDLLVVSEALKLAGPIHNETGGNGVDDLVAGRVYINTVADDFDGESQAGIRIHGGGIRAEYAPLFEGRYNLDCFGGTAQPVDSYTLARTVLDRLAGANMITTASGVVLRAVQLGDLVLMDDPSEQGIYVTVPMELTIRD